MFSYSINILYIYFVYMCFSLTHISYIYNYLNALQDLHFKICALQDLYPDSYRLLFTTGSFTLTTSPLSNEPGVQRVQRSNMLEG